MTTAPTAVPIPADTWTKVLTAVQDGMVWVGDTDPVYFHQTVATGGVAPSGLDTAAVLPLPGLPVSSSFVCDVYVYAVGQAGKVTVSAP
jgi:hypothetical protein